jgi:hypothetical protein
MQGIENINGYLDSKLVLITLLNREVMCLYLYCGVCVYIWNWTTFEHTYTYVCNQKQVGGGSDGDIMECSSNKAERISTPLSSCG